MGLDPQAKLFLDLMKQQNTPALDQLSIEENRNLNKKLTTFGGQPERVNKVEDVVIPVREGQITLRLYTPSGEGPFPVFIYYHGGGWVLGDLDIVDVPLRSITNSSNALVVSVDYRLAPENKFPTAPEDCYQALQWVASNISSYNGDRNRIAVGGDSAGGNLATVVTQMAKQREGPFISYQVLIYPATQFSFHTQSHLENGENYFLTKSSMIYFAKQYISEKEKNHPYASPLLAPDLTSLPPALIITAEYDPLRDEGEAYANRLKESGVPVQLERYEGMIHGFFWLSGIMDQGKKAIDQIGSILKEHFSNSISHI